MANINTKTVAKKQDDTTFGANSIGVSLQGITKIFPLPDGKGEFTAVNNVNLDIQEGEMVTLLGPSGCGKTTTLRMISGFEYPTSGKILFGGTDVAMAPPNKRDISMVFQSYALFPHMSIWENIAYGLHVKKLTKDEVVRRTEKVMKLMQLNGMETRFPNQLSGGQQQRVALARAIIIEPKVLLFDEPLSNLDAKLREKMRDEIRLLQKRLGITSLYVTHDQSEAMAISDKIVIMKDGIMAQVGSPSEIYEFPVSKFVANFIGRANFIPGKLVEKQGAGATIAMGDKKLSVPNAGASPVAVGESCCVTFRPEAVDLVAQQTPEAIPAVIQKAVYFGNMIEYEMEMLGETIVAEIYNPQNKTRYQPGDAVFACIDNRCARILPND